MKITNKQVLEYLLENLEWDGHAYWLPEIAVKGGDGSNVYTPPPTLAEMKEAILERLK